ncbi:MAG: 4Fe-4S binding protein, partial [Gracilibacteraceae bacterium]|nr:4Fe-4S binding protein [Gracilibacteraceae bacterium]
MKISRRDFLKAAGAAGIAAMGMMHLRSAGAAVISPDEKDLSSASVARDLSKCIGCGNCVRVCADVQKIGVYQLYPDPDPARHGGREYYANTKNEISLAETACINCGQCTKVCPVGALTEKDGLAEARRVLSNQDQYHVVWQIAPSVQNMLGEAHAARPGADVSRKIASAMKRLGGHAFHTDFAADVTIMEEGSELIRRLRGGGTLPMLTSCCPGWVRYAEMHYPDLLSHVSSTKSPQQIFGALAKSYYAEKYQVAPDDVYQISIMPCTAKKYECARDEMRDAQGRRQVDLVLTAREFTELLAEEHINLNTLDDSEFDRFMQEGSGAARIFGASGGVM